MYSSGNHIENKRRDGAEIYPYHFFTATELNQFGSMWVLERG